MNNPAPLNGFQYLIVSSSSIGNEKLKDFDVNTSRIIVFNEGSVPVFVKSGQGSSPTATLPVAGTPQQGKIVAAGSTQTFAKDPTHDYISIRFQSGDGNVHFSVSNGE